MDKNHALFTPKKNMNHKEQQILFQSETNKSRNKHFIERLKMPRRWIL